MYIIPEKKFCYLANPRTGSKATVRALQQRGARLLGTHHHLPTQHIGVVKPGWTVVSTVRNHWDTMVSWWFKNKQIIPFDKFLPTFTSENVVWVQNRRLWWRAEPFTNRTMRYETLQDDLDAVLKECDIEPVELPVVKDSERSGRYQLYYRQGTRKWVEEYFKDEIKEYGYRYGD